MQRVSLRCYVSSPRVVVGALRRARHRHPVRRGRRCLCRRLPTRSRVSRHRAPSRSSPRPTRT